jgi:hypothetical protein
MQVRLWPQNEKGLKILADQPSAKALRLSVAKIANFAIAQYIVHKSAKKK